MLGRAVVSAQGVLLQKFIHPVLSAGVHARRDRLAHTFGVVHLRCGKQGDLAGIAPGIPRRFRDPVSDERNIFCNRHFIITFPSNISSFVRITSSSGQRLSMLDWSSLTRY